MQWYRANQDLREGNIPAGKIRLRRLQRELSDWFRAHTDEAIKDGAVEFESSPVMVPGLKSPRRRELKH